MSLQPVLPDADFSTAIESLGECTIASPVKYKRFISDEERVLYDLDHERIRARMQSEGRALAFERAGPRERIYFDPANVKAGIVTCGGLCPGLNDVIRSIVHELTYGYGVRHIKGIRYGYAGLNPAVGLPLIDLTPDMVRSIHEDGGTFLGSSRGPQPVEVMADTLYREEIRILFTIGGDGTLKGAKALYDELARRDLKIAVVGVPKTIDNDICFVSRTFGFDTAVSTAVESLRCAHVEAVGAPNGIGIVKLMGRQSGFVAAHAAIAEGDANFVLVPEVPFELEGPDGLLAALEARMDRRGHALLVVAEGAGQDLFSDDLGVDASGNRKLGDIGALLKGRIQDYFRSRDKDCAVKYIDPSYIIRSVPANPNDCIFCNFLGQKAVHAGMAGKTGMLIGSWNNLFVHVPLDLATGGRKHIQTDGTLWLSVLESTGQPERMVSGS
ncbi:MAG: ATP-dependent 6-phosphofructokinase [Deltaproteobacteria bacterium]|nr:ATP-dependent 6-phosphofructokinase [Deltaproteobacteria bacterium]